MPTRSKEIAEKLDISVNTLECSARRADWKQGTQKCHEKLQAQMLAVI